MPLDLLIPDLLLPAHAPEAMRAARMPALERWLVRGEATRRPEGGATSLLASAFSLPDPPPVAAIALAADDRARPGTWMRADPVHLRIDRDALLLQDPAAVGAHEAAELAGVLQDHFRGDGLEFVVAASDRWYVRVPEGEAPRTVALDEALGRNVFGLLPGGGGRINWASALTEAQMLLSPHEVNARREAEGRPPVNSVWFWGGGEAPARIASPYALVHADDAFTRGLAQLSGTRWAPTPARLDEVDAVRAGESALVRQDALAEAVRRADAAAWIAAAERLDRDWFVDLADTIERFESVRVILPTGRDTLVASVTASARWRWLRRARPLSSHA